MAGRLPRRSHRLLPPGTTGWKTTLTYPSGVTVTQTWNASLTGTYTFTNLSWNTSGGTFGFLGTWTGSGTPPTPVVTTSGS
ncbi:cellulose binding domain-containing protein [Nonomuraea dietziae]|uniref:cellulose binding domain-containing protein n=1 Tax=Nonomuraea dietziae TaxID=65515 RepID=UPI003620C6D3